MTSNSLRILFFGSDKFSVYSLQKLYNLHQRNANLIESLQVVSRPAKWGGKKRTILRIPQLIQDMSRFETLPEPLLCDNKNELVDKLLPLIQRQHINMLICVSFGLLIPNDLIENVPYTLNLHPSLLPRYMGSAPIQYVLLNNDKFTGITVQSLHPTKFDKGQIIAQSDELEVSKLLKKDEQINDSTPVYSSRLTNKLGQLGAKLLGDVITNKSYLKPLADNELRKYKPSLAPRIQTIDKMIQWGQEDASQIYRRLMTLGPLYTFIKCGYNEKTGKKISKRVILHSFTVKEDVSKQPHMKSGSFQFSGDNNGQLTVSCGNETAIDIKTIQIAGSKVVNPSQFFSIWQKQFPSNKTINSTQPSAEFQFYCE
ncbi:methionyl-tRNA formyltransferase, mitochondrial [Monosporozyma unispora]